MRHCGVSSLLGPSADTFLLPAVSILGGHACLGQGHNPQVSWGLFCSSFLWLDQTPFRCLRVLLCKSLPLGYVSLRVLWLFFLGLLHRHVVPSTHPPFFFSSLFVFFIWQCKYSQQSPAAREEPSVGVQYKLIIKRVLAPISLLGLPLKKKKLQGLKYS